MTGRLSAASPEVRTFVAAYEENKNLTSAGRPSGYRIVVVERRKYLAVDEVLTFEGADCPGQSGRFMVDRETGAVFTILGYGKRGHRVGTLEGLTAKYLKGSATFWPDARSHSETSRSRVARWSR